MRLATLILVVTFTFGCSFEFQRASDLGPGDIAGRAVSETGAPLPFSRVQIDGTSRVVLADRSGDFVVRGLPAGTWALRLTHDLNGDGLPEHAGFRAAQLRQSDGVVGFLILGEVTLDIVAKATGFVRDQDGTGVPNAKVVVVRAAELEAGLFVEGGVEQLTSTDADGAFVFPALAAGELSFKAFLEVGAGAFLSSEPVTVTLAPDADLDLPVATLVIDRDSPVERQVQIELTPAPDGQDVKVILTQPGLLPAPGDVEDFESGLVVAGGPSVNFAAVPVGHFDVHLVTSGGARGLLCGQAPAAPGPLLEIWGAVELSDDACVASAAGDRDCDDDGQAGLPVDDNGPDIAVWTECAPACAAGFGAAGANPTCETSAGTFDCDDDGDGQPDVTEPFVCTTRCAGHDTDGDGVCQYLDRFPQCASDDPADPACNTDLGPTFVRPPIRPEYGGPRVDVPDAGPVNDAGVPVDAGDPDAGPDAGPLVLPLIANNIQPHFAAAQLWGEHLSVDGTGQPVDTTCDGANIEHASQCAHGAERLSVFVPELTGCAGVTVRDELGAFDWRCVEATGVELHSNGLADGRGLQTLIDFGAEAFAPNRIIIEQDGVPTLATDFSTWWTNAMALANGGLVFGDAVADTIYLVTAPVDQSTWTLDAAGSALVVAPGVVLRHFDGVPGGGFGVVTLDSDRTWFEGDLDLAALGQTGIQLNLGTLHTLRNVSMIIGADQPAIVAQASGPSRISDVFIDGGRPLNISGSAGFIVERLKVTGGLSPVRFGGDNHVVRDVFITNDATGSAAGLSVECSNSVFQNVHVSNCDSNGIDVLGPANVLTQVALGHNQVFGVTSDNDDLHLHHATLYGNNTGAIVQGFGSHVQASLLTANDTGLLSDSGGNVFYEDVAIVGNAQDDILLIGTTDFNFFGGRLWADGGGCSVSSSGSTPGLIDGSCTDDGAALSSTYTGQNSDAILHPQVDPSGALAGALNVDDAANASDSLGAALFDNITDFTSFDRTLRAWGAPSPLFTNTGRCTTGQTCAIYDVSLLAGEAGDPNAGGAGVFGPLALDAIALPTFADVVRWEGFANVPADCDAIHFGSIFDNKAECRTEFLADAIEILGDDRGNEDGLCESDEACIFNPNLGAYPGHGPLVVLQDPFTAGTVTGVRLLGHQSNGF